MTPSTSPSCDLLSLRYTIVWAIVAIAAFHLAYGVAALSCLIGLYLFALVQLARAATAKRAFLIGWLTGLCIVAPQLGFMFHLFSLFGVVLWLVGSFWTGLFVLLGHLAIRRFEARGAIVLLPTLYLAVEYFRSELYPLKFSWLAPGYTFTGHGQPLFAGYVGMYGVGCLLMFIAAGLAHLKPRLAVGIGSGLLVVLGTLANLPQDFPAPSTTKANGPLIVGIQLEFPNTARLVQSLDNAVKQHPQVKLLVLSEYTLQGAPADAILNWCRQNKRFLIVGGMDLIPDEHGAFDNRHFYNTAFVISDEGKVVFKQAKSVPIPFFDDGKPAVRQQLWDSPWGKIGICICYDLSYSRVVDELVRQGAQLLIVPTMDVTAWGEHEHWLHAKVAPTRAAEYHLPIVRVCSSGISQLITPAGQVTHRLTFPGQGESFAAHVPLVSSGRIPLDRRLAPLALILTVLFLGFLVLESRRKKGVIPRFRPADRNNPSPTR